MLKPAPAAGAGGVSAGALAAAAAAVQQQQQQQRASGKEGAAAAAGAGAPIEITTSASAQEKVQYLVGWLAEGEIDIKGMIECTQDIVSLYEVWEQYSEKTCKEQIGKFVKAGGLEA